MKILLHLTIYKMIGGPFSPIDPKYLKSYTWEYAQTDNEVTVNFLFPETFNLDSFQCTLEDNDISCYAPGYLPFISGCLERPIKSHNIEIKTETREIILHLIKNTPETWDLIITKPGSKNNDIDPKSAYLLFVFHSQREAQLTQEEREMYGQLLQFSASAGFPPALNTLGTVLFQDPNTREAGLRLLSTSAEQYQDPQAFFYLGYYMLGTEQNGLAIQLLHQSFEMSFKPAGLLLGRIYSPTSGLDVGIAKDGTKALEYLSQSSLPESLLEQAKLYNQGCKEVPQDKQKAEELLNQFKKETDNQDLTLESLEVKEPESSTGKTVLAALATTGIITLLGTLLYFQFKKHRK